MRDHYITENPSGYRGRLFPPDNRAFFLSLNTVLAIDANKYNTEDRGGKRVQRWGRNSSSAALISALSISLKRWQMKNKRGSLLVLLINNKPFEHRESHAPIVSWGWGPCDWQLGMLRQQWDEVTNWGQGWAQSLALTGTLTSVGPGRTVNLLLQSSPAFNSIRSQSPSRGQRCWCH